jgi:hypothetical protein
MCHYEKDEVAREAQLQLCCLWSSGPRKQFTSVFGLFCGSYLSFRLHSIVFQSRVARRQECDRGRTRGTIRYSLRGARTLYEPSAAIIWWHLPGPGPFPASVDRARQERYHQWTPQTCVVTTPSNIKTYDRGEREESHQNRK